MARISAAAGFMVLLAGASCGRPPGPSAAAGPSAEVKTLGSIEVTAQLEEIPDGAIFKRDLYDYTTILKYKVLKVHRGEVKGEEILIGHYNPFKPRSEAADRQVREIGGSVRRFEAGQVHRMALEVPLDDHFMGGVINKYFGKETGPLYWAVWTDPEDEK